MLSNGDYERARDLFFLETRNNTFLWGIMSSRLFVWNLRWVGETRCERDRKLRFSLREDISGTESRIKINEEAF